MQLLLLSTPINTRPRVRPIRKTVRLTTMSMSSEAAAEALKSARLKNSQIADVNGYPASEAEGYLAQRAMMANSGDLGKVIGWKNGATNQGAQTSLGFGPFYGPLFASCMLPTGAKLDIAKYGARLLALETEFAFVLSRDLPPRASPYTEAEVWAAVEGVAPALEVAATRFACAPLPPGALVADGAGNGAAIVGPVVPAAEIDWSRLSEVAATLQMNGAEVAASTGANVLGSPLASLAWLANALSAAGLTLEAGHVVLSGAAVAHREAPHGATVTASLRGLLAAGPSATSHDVHATIL